MVQLLYKETRLHQVELTGCALISTAHQNYSYLSQFSDTLPSVTLQSNCILGYTNCAVIIHLAGCHAAVASVLRVVRVLATRGRLGLDNVKLSNSAPAVVIPPPGESPTCPQLTACNTNSKTSQPNRPRSSPPSCTNVVFLQSSCSFPLPQVCYVHVHVPPECFGFISQLQLAVI